MSNILDEPERKEEKPDNKSRNAIWGGIGLIVISIGWTALCLRYDQEIFEQVIIFLAGVFLVLKTLATGISGEK